MAMNWFKSYFCLVVRGIFLDLLRLQVQYGENSKDKTCILLEVKRKSAVVVTLTLEGSGNFE